MGDVPRGPLDQEPDELGWWQASDGKWYPPESAPTMPVPVTSPAEATSVLPVTSATEAASGPVAWVKGMPLWAKIAVPVVAVLLIAAIAGGGGKSNKKALAKVATTTVASTTTTEAVTTTAPTTTLPPATVSATTAPPATSPPPTAPPVTRPPATSPFGPRPTQGGPADPGDSKNCSDFSTYAQAKAWFDTYFPYYGDVAHLDADHDGIPCESLPGAP